MSIDPVSIDEVLRVAVERGDVPNVVAIAADRDGVIYRGAAGPRSAESSDPISADTHFRIMSMTKMVATVAALQLVETGRLDLDAPIDTYCPEFADVQVLDGFDGDTPRLRAPASRATVKQLVTHTTGLGYWFWSEELAKWEAATSTPNVLSGDQRDLHGAAARRSRHHLRLRDQHRLAGQGRRGRGRRRAGRRDQGRHHRAARHGRDRLPDRRGVEGRRPDPRAGEGRRRVGRQRHRAEPEPGVLRGRARAVLDAQRLHQVRAGAAARRRA